MLFKFLKYVNPISYFNLTKNNGETIFPDWHALPKDIQKKISFDNRYNSPYSSELDASWQAVRKGYIGNAKTIKFDNKKIPTIDEYHFIRKYFSKIWVFYTLIIRILTLKNPFKEISSFYKTRRIKKEDTLKNLITYEDWNNFNSTLINEKPFVSIIIPTLNRYRYLKKALKDLEKQTYSNFEVIIVDQSDDFSNEFYTNFKLDIKLYYQKEKALWKARNFAIKNSNGEYIALFEDDVSVKKKWLENHLKCIDFFNVDISTGVFFPENSTIPKHSNFFFVSKQFATGNALLRKNVFKTTGLFDRQFEKQRMGDGEFGLRAYLHNFKSVNNPLAYCIDLKAPDGGLRVFGSWDAFRNKKILSPKPMPSVVYLYRKYYGKKITIYGLIKQVPPSLVSYKFKRNKKMLILGFIISFLIFPVVLYRVLKSWNLASKKLKQGDLIEKYI